MAIGGSLGQMMDQFEQTMPYASSGLDMLTGKEGRDKAKAFGKDTEHQADQDYGQTQKENAGIDQYSKQYDNTLQQDKINFDNRVQKTVQPYTDMLQRNLNEAQGQANDARKVYKQSIQPMQKNNMEEAMRNAQGAMSLSEAGDANNALQSGIRNRFDAQAAGVMNQGAAGSGILQALGNQQAGQVAQQTPGMNAGAVQAMQQGAQGQAQNRMAQGMNQASDLQNQGINLASQMNNQYYQAGQDAQRAAAGATNDYMQGGLDYSNQQNQARNEQGAIGGELYDTMNGLAEGNLNRNNQLSDDLMKSKQQAAARNQAAINQRYGTQIASMGARGQAEAAGSNGALPIMGGVLGRMLGG